MSAKPVPPPPPPPDFSERPQKTWWTVILAVIGLVIGFVVLSFLTLGFISPLAVIGLIFFVLCGVQYLVWGWLFERIFRNGKERLEE